jgi:hypothetical protein
MPRFGVLIACLLMVAGSVGVRADDLGPAKDVPELQVLQHYAGTWDVELTGNGSGKGEATAKWILGGRYLEQSGVIHNMGSPDIWITTLFTFDPGKQKYRVWTFASNGSTGQAEMTWDAKAKVMTSVSPPDMNGIRSTNTADFSTPGKERWRFIYTDRDGKQVGEMSGENTLRKGSPAKPGSVIAAKEPDRSAELKQLDRFLGTWKTEYRVPKAEWTPEERNGSAEMNFSLELGGKMVRERTKHADGTENTFLMLFDANKKQYRAWWFSSAAEVTGQPNNSTGQWDEAAKTFTWKLTDANGLINTAQHRFVGDKLDWTVLVENPQKVAMFRMEGTSSKAKETKSLVK